MTATAQDAEAFAGDDKTIQFTVTDLDGAALDLTNATIEWVLRRYEGGPVALRKTLADGIVVTAPTGGIFAVTISAADTASMEPGVYYHGAAVTIDGKISTVAIGLVTLRAKVRQ